MTGIKEAITYYWRTEDIVGLSYYKSQWTWQKRNGAKVFSVPAWLSSFIGLQCRLVYFVRGVFAYMTRGAK